MKIRGGPRKARTFSTSDVAFRYEVRPSAASKSAGAPPTVRDFEALCLAREVLSALRLFAQGVQSR